MSPWESSLNPPTKVIGLFVVLEPLNFDSFDKRPLCQVDLQRWADKKAIPGDSVTLTHLTGRYMHSHTRALRHVHKHK